MSQQAGQDTPIRINPGEWDVVLRNGQPTLVPKRAINAPPLQTANARATEVANDPTLQIAHRVSERARFQALTLYHAAQQTGLNEDQYSFLKNELAKLRHEIAVYDQNIEQRRDVNRYAGLLEFFRCERCSNTILGSIRSSSQTRALHAPSNTPLYQRTHLPISQSVTANTSQNAHFLYPHQSVYPAPGYPVHSAPVAPAPNGNNQIPQPSYYSQVAQIVPQASTSNRSRALPSPPITQNAAINIQPIGAPLPPVRQQTTPVASNRPQFAVQSVAPFPSQTVDQTPYLIPYSAQGSNPLLANSSSGQGLNQPPNRQVQSTPSTSRNVNTPVQPHRASSQSQHSRPVGLSRSYLYPLPTQQQSQGEIRRPLASNPASTAPVQLYTPTLNGGLPLIEPAPAGLARSVLQMLQKRKEMDSAGTSSTSSKRVIPSQSSPIPFPSPNPATPLPPPIRPTDIVEPENNTSLVDDPSAPEGPAAHDTLESTLVTAREELADTRDPMIIDDLAVQVDPGIRIEEATKFPVSDTKAPSRPYPSDVREAEEPDRTDDRKTEPLFLPESPTPPDEKDEESMERPLHRFLYVLVPRPPELGLTPTSSTSDVEIKEILEKDDAKRLTAQDCDFITRREPQLLSHIEEQHDGDMSLLKPIVNDLYYGLPEPMEPLPDVAPSSEAVKFPVYGHPSARLVNRTPSPKPVSSAVALMPLSPIKRTARSAYSQESPILEHRTSSLHDDDDSELEGREILDKYAFLEPFYRVPFTLDVLDSDEEVARSFDRETRRSALKQVSKVELKRGFKPKKPVKGVRFASPNEPVHSRGPGGFTQSDTGSSTGIKPRRKTTVHISQGRVSGHRSESEPTDDDELLLRP
ncbi:hypothetical protein PIIN_05648 [Serendipita indica DSM 11827]|uniref:Uncharacterized protein n=1 Tax=Serendipita indica (strain DSM 11827) TaxID=1109443 RepID=G4TK72_SERID|nr:hypothetical protein PIIN_05648 [Serendipita indica DSM 11827]